MTKLSYPTDGVWPRCQGHIESVANHLSGAINNCSFDIPADFPHRGYLAGLGGKLSGYRNEANNIGAKIQDTDRKFSRLSDQLEARATRVTPNKVTKRERMIV